MCIRDSIRPIYARRPREDPRKEIACVVRCKTVADYNRPIHLNIAVLGESVSVSVSASWNASINKRTHDRLTQLPRIIAWWRKCCAIEPPYTAKRNLGMISSRISLGPVTWISRIVKRNDAKGDYFRHAIGLHTRNVFKTAISIVSLLLCANCSLPTAQNAAIINRQCFYFCPFPVISTGLLYIAL